MTFEILNCKVCKKEIQKLNPYFKETDGSIICYGCKRNPKSDETKVVDAPKSDARTWLDPKAGNWDLRQLPQTFDELCELMEAYALPIQQQRDAIAIALGKLSMVLGNPAFYTRKPIEVALIEFAIQRLQDIKDGQ